ncbi:MAG: hypothetical protein AB7F59_14955 [Bdellovibrionales bacterium]
MKKTTDLLIDLMENELEKSHKQDMRRYVQNSPASMAELEALQKTKSFIKKSEGLVPDMSEAMQARLHSQIMSAIKDVKQETPTRFIFGSVVFRSSLMASAVIAVLLLSGLALWQVLGPRVSIQQVAKDSENQNTDLMLAISVEVPEAFADSLLSEKNEIDFYLDAAAQKVVRLKNEDANEFYNEFME